MIKYSKQDSCSHVISPLDSASSSMNPLINSNNRNRKYLLFCAFSLTLLLGSSLQRASSYLPATYDLRGYQKAFTRTYLSRDTTSAVLEVQSLDVLQRTPVLIRDDALYCDRSHHRTDVCVAKGDVRVVGGSSAAHAGEGYTVLLLAESGETRVERLRPYTRKWEESVMKSIDEVTIIKKVYSRERRAISRSFDSSSTDQEISAVPPRYSADAYNSWNPSLQQKVKAVKQSAHPASSTSRKLQEKLKHKRGFHRKQLPQERKSFVKSDLSISDHSSALQARPDQRAVQGAKRKRGGARLQAALYSDQFPVCEVRHEVPAIIFSTGGYTGNVYHEFNDGLIPLFITAQQYAPGQVVLVVLEYHEWWMSKYAEVVAQISNYTVIDLARDKRVHCFPEITVGLYIHDELSIHADHLHRNHRYASMQGFQSVLRAAYLPALQGLSNTIRSTVPASNPDLSAIAKRPKLVILSRRSPRAILNQKELITLAKKIGFSVEVLSPSRFTSMVKIYWAMSTCDVMVGVHGAAMTHLIFMRPGATLIQVVPLGTDWAAATYYGEPARKLGLKYVEYKVSARESTLWERYARDDPVLVNPESVNRKGWGETKRIYLEGQDVRVSLARMRLLLSSAYNARRAAVDLTTPLN